MEKVKKVEYGWRGVYVVLGTGVYLGSIALIDTITINVLILAAAVHISELIYSMVFNNKSRENKRWIHRNITDDMAQNVLCYDPPIYPEGIKGWIRKVLKWEHLFNLIRIASWICVVAMIVVVMAIAGWRMEAWFIGSFATFMITIFGCADCKNEVTLDHWTGHSANNVYGWGSR